MSNFSTPHFITFEGCEGSGKSTQILKLQSFLQAQGVAVELTREPGGTTLGHQIRELLLTGDSDKVAPVAELLLYAADRAQHVRGKLLPALEQGLWVLCDRFSDSTVAYQGYGRGLDLATIESLNQLARQGLKPDLTFLLDVPVELGLSRSRRRLEAATNPEDRFEKEETQFHEKVRRGFLELASLEPERFVVLDASLEKDALHAQIVEHLRKRGWLG